jgi:hypothetical protein
MKKQVFWLQDHPTDPALPPGTNWKDTGLSDPMPPTGAGQWPYEIFVSRYSGATARDFHPFPYSPLTVTRGTLSYLPQYIVELFKELYS